MSAATRPPVSVRMRSISCIVTSIGRGNRPSMSGMAPCLPQADAHSNLSRPDEIRHFRRSRASPGRTGDGPSRAGGVAPGPLRRTPHPRRRSPGGWDSRDFPPAALIFRLDRAGWAVDDGAGGGPVWRSVMSLLCLVAVLSGTPIRQAEAANDLTGSHAGSGGDHGSPALILKADPASLLTWMSGSHPTPKWFSSSVPPLLNPPDTQDRRRAERTPWLPATSGRRYAWLQCFLF